MIHRMRPVIIAGNWKMHTTPADAGELARTCGAVIQPAPPARKNPARVMRDLCTVPLRAI